MPHSWLSYHLFIRQKLTKQVFNTVFNTVLGSSDRNIKGVYLSFHLHGTKDF